MGKRGPLTGLGVVSVVTGVGARPWPGGQILESTPALPTTSRPCRLCRVGHGGSLVRLRGAASGDDQDPMKTGVTLPLSLGTEQRGLSDAPELSFILGPCGSPCGGPGGVRDRITSPKTSLR